MGIGGEFISTLSSSCVNDPKFIKCFTRGNEAKTVRYAYQNTSEVAKGFMSLLSSRN